MKRSVYAAIVGMLTMLSLTGSAAAQWFGLGEWEGAYESSVEHTRQDSKTENAIDNRMRNTLTENRLTMRTAGAYVLDPDFISLSVGGTLGLSQQWLRGTAFNDSDNGMLLGYDFLSTLLPGRPYSLNLFANRNQSTLSGGLAGQIRLLAENRGATLFADRLYIPSSFTFRQEIEDQEFRSGNVVTHRRDRRNAMTYEGQRGWIDSEMNFKYEYVDLADQVLPRLSYRSHESILYYNLEFGPELNRRWDSRLRFFSRAGLTDITSLNVDELLLVDHTDRLQSGYRYSLMRVDSTGIGATTTHTAEFGLRHQTYKNLTTRFGLEGIFQTLPDGQRDQYRSRLNFTYTKRLPGDGRLDIDTGGGLEYDNSRFRGTESAIFQETHTFTPPQPIFLVNPSVVTFTVVVIKTAGSATPGCPALNNPDDPLLENVDYTLVTLGELVEIRPINVPIPPRLTPCITAGDTIAVDYRFGVSPSLSYMTIPWHFNVSVDYRWIRPYFIHEQTIQNRLTGTDGGFLDSQLSDTLGVEFRYDGQRLRGSVLGEGRRYASDRIDYNMYRSSQFLSYSIRPEMTLTLTADQSLFFFSRPQRQSQTVAGRAMLSYSLGPLLFADAYGAIRLFKDNTLPDERTIEAGIRLRLNYRRTEVVPTLEFIDWRRGQTETRDIRLGLRLIRRF